VASECDKRPKNSSIFV